MKLIKTLKIYAAPQGQPRSRPRWGGKGYFIKQTPFFTACIMTAQMNRPKQPLQCAVAVHLHLWFARPKSRRRLAEIHQKVRPDVDNVAKAALDAMTHAGWWKDDAIVAELQVFKKYADDGGQAGARINIYELPTEEKTP